MSDGLGYMRDFSLEVDDEVAPSVGSRLARTSLGKMVAISSGGLFPSLTMPKPLQFVALITMMARVT